MRNDNDSLRCDVTVLEHDKDSLSSALDKAQREADFYKSQLCPTTDDGSDAEIARLTEILKNAQKQIEYLSCT